MLNRKIKGFIVEGADQQGKTTLVDMFVKKGFKSFKFGMPEKNFDFFEDYIKPFSEHDVTVYDRSFVSEYVYSRVVPGRRVRVERFEELVKYFKDKGFVFLFLEREGYSWEDREEEFDRRFNERFLDEYRKTFDKIDCEKYYINPEKISDYSFLEDLVSNSYSPRRLLQEIYRHDIWKMIVSCIFLNNTQRQSFDKIRCDFFKKYPNASSFLESEEQDIKDSISYLGLGNVRYKRIVNFSEDLLNGLDPSICRSVGEYAYDSYRIFCLNDTDVNPKDNKLKEYLLWKKSL